MGPSNSVSFAAQTRLDPAAAVASATVTVAVAVAVAVATPRRSGYHRFIIALLHSLNDVNIKHCYCR